MESLGSMFVFISVVSIFSIFATTSTELPSWVTVGLTPTVLAGLFLTGAIKTGKDYAAAIVRAEAAEERERKLSEALVDRILPTQMQSITVMEKVTSLLERRLTNNG